MISRILFCLLFLNVWLFGQEFNSREIIKRSKIKSVTIYQVEEALSAKYFNLLKDKDSKRKYYCKYDKYGNNNEIIDFDVFGEVYKYLNEFDENGNLTKSFLYDEALKKYRLVCIKLYDENGNVTKTELYDSYGNIFCTVVYKYLKNQLVEEINTLNNNNEKTYFKYDNKGRVIEETVGQHDGEITKKTIYKYSSKYREKKTINLSSGKEYGSEIIKYNKSGHLIEKLTFQQPYIKPKTCEIYSYTYNKDGTIQQCFKKDDSDKVIVTYNYVYHYYM